MLGGGLAGIAAAVRLSEGGAQVTLLEASRRLGGRATSFVDRASGQSLDNCQHVLLGCCTNLVDLYRRLGVADRIRWHRRLHFQDGKGVRDRLEAAALPAPLHLMPSLLRFRALGIAEKAAIARAMFAMLRLGTRGRAALDGQTFAQWLSGQRQPPGAIEQFWSVLVTSALNEWPRRAAADMAIQVFQDGLLRHRHAYTVGVPTVPLVQLYDSAARLLAARGGTVRLGASVEAMAYDGGRIGGVLVSGAGRLSADAYVSGLPFDRLARICPPALRDADGRLGHLAFFEVSPIIGIHLWLDRPVLDLPHLILTQSPLQWLFDKGRDGAAGAQHLHAVISAAHDMVEQSPEELAALAVREVRRALPAAAEALVVHRRVVKEKRATFAPTVGSDAIRPGARGAVPNLYLAGDWCRTGWPATMEGAVRSGYLAASAVLADMTRAPPAPPVPDLPMAALCRLLQR